MLESIKNKIITLETAGFLLEHHETLALCHGNFDLIHPGHLEHFEFARSYADRLVVSVNDDQSCKTSKKGPERPSINEEARVYHLASLMQVDYVYLCREPIPVAFIRRFRPEFYVKGIEYAPASYGGSIPEADLVRAYGGQLVFGPEHRTYSSRALTRFYDAYTEANLS